MKNKSRLMSVEDEQMRSEADNRLWYPERIEGYVPLVKEVIKTPLVKSKWQHYNGAKYKVIAIANEEDTKKYPKIVVYKGKNGKVWVRPLTDWYRSFTEIN
jgi:hypothetical protein